MSKPTVKKKNSEEITSSWIIEMSIYYAWVQNNS